MIKLKEILSINVDAEGKSAKEVETEVLNSLEDIKDKIVALKVSGCLSEGRIADIDFKAIEDKAKDFGCFTLLRNTSKLITKEFKLEIQSVSRSAEEIEKAVIDEYVSELESKDKKSKKELLNSMLMSLNLEKKEGESSAGFESRVIEDVFSVLKINESKEEVKE